MFRQALFQNLLLSTKHRMHPCIKLLPSGNIFSYGIGNVCMRVDKSRYDYESVCGQILARTLVTTCSGPPYFAIFYLNVALLDIFKLSAQKKAGVSYS